MVGFSTLLFNHNAAEATTQALAGRRGFIIATGETTTQPVQPTSSYFILLSRISIQVLHKHFRGGGVWGHAYQAFFGNGVQNFVKKMLV